MFVCATGACVSITYEAHKSGCSVIVLRCGYVFFESNLMSNVYVVQMLPDVPRCSHADAARCSQMLPDEMLPCRCCQMLPDVPRCSHADAARCSQMLPDEMLPDAPMPPDAPRCCRMLPDAAGCSQMLPDAPRCAHMLPDAARCSQMLPDAPRSP